MEGLQKQKSSSGSTSVSPELEIEAAVVFRLTKTGMLVTIIFVELMYTIKQAHVVYT